MGPSSKDTYCVDPSDTFLENPRNPLATESESLITARSVRRSTRSARKEDLENQEREGENRTDELALRLARSSLREQAQPEVGEIPQRKEVIDGEGTNEMDSSYEGSTVGINVDYAEGGYDESEFAKESRTDPDFVFLESRPKKYSRPGKPRLTRANAIKNGNPVKEGQLKENSPIITTPRPTLPFFPVSTRYIENPVKKSKNTQAPSRETVILDKLPKMANIKHSSQFRATSETFDLTAQTSSTGIDATQPPLRTSRDLHYQTLGHPVFHYRQQPPSPQPPGGLPFRIPCESQLSDPRDLSQFFPVFQSSSQSAGLKQNPAKPFLVAVSNQFLVGSALSPKNDGPEPLMELESKPPPLSAAFVATNSPPESREKNPVSLPPAPRFISEQNLSPFAQRISRPTNRIRAPSFCPDISKTLVGTWFFWPPSDAASPWGIPKIGMTAENLLLHTTEDTAIAFPWSKLVCIDMVENGNVHIVSKPLRQEGNALSSVLCAGELVDVRYRERVANFIFYLKKCKAYYDPLEID
jgi:hypothetical protein